jgi:hypothetical protein
MEFMLAIIKGTVDRPEETLAQVVADLTHTLLGSVIRSGRRAFITRISLKRYYSCCCDQVVSETYKATLMQYHGFMVSTAFTVGPHRGLCVQAC